MYHELILNFQLSLSSLSISIIKSKCNMSAICVLYILAIGIPGEFIGLSVIYFLSCHVMVANFIMGKNIPFCIRKM
jgi:hypothetical protein